MQGNSIRVEISRLLNVRKKLNEEEYITSREEDETSTILGIGRFKDKKDMLFKINDFFAWLNKELGEKAN